MFIVDRLERIGPDEATCQMKYAGTEYNFVVKLDRSIPPLTAVEFLHLSSRERATLEYAEEFRALVTLLCDFIDGADVTLPAIVESHLKNK